MIAALSVLPTPEIHLMAGSLSSTTLIVFAKAPRPGRCKTRLARRMGHGLATRCYQAMTEQVVAQATRLAPGAVVLAVAPDTRHPFFKRLARVYGCRLRRQARGDLGRRMHHALAQAQRADGTALVVGTDQPDLDGGRMAELLERATERPACVMAPTDDGGYWTIGGQQTPAELFRGVAWSTPRVAGQTRQAARRLGLACIEGPRMRDIDDYRDWCGQPRSQRARLLRAAVMPGRRRGLVSP